MTYQLTSGDTILRTTDGAFIPPDPGNRDYASYLAWLEEGNTPEPAPAPPAPGPDYKGFYDGLLISTAYQNIRTQAVASLPLTLAAVEFSAAMGDAKAGAPNQAALQACINNIAITATDLTEDDWTEIGGLLAANNLADLYTLPSEDIIYTTGTQELLWLTVKSQI
jgi:hypothetical protein